ncbi:hypothetical protein WL047_03720 [Vibrio alginolyticus]|uniref:hypothetical protein n=1 Tax=Vibrio alginolyticus TaxID=663 RepID=UPI0021CF1C61|nr:hypothetical protein [Vibrio parahaemolyticus]MDF4699758.1 hypothetical protein [Vibrio parahaemolyticus]HCG7654234.1 hypothetical protein [Vibrio parahaemolyticus]
MKRIWSLFMRVLLALNMFVLHLLTGQSDPRLAVGATSVCDKVSVRPSSWLIGCS